MILKNRLFSLFLGFTLLLPLLAGCGAGASTTQPDPISGTEAPATAGQSPDEPEAGEAEAGEPVTLLIAAAASLEYTFVEELIPRFQDRYPRLAVAGTYDSSGKLQTQIEEGLEADVFFSAAMKQMNELSESGLVDSATVVELLENKIVLIKSSGADIPVSGFEDILEADVIALGDPESVPVGQYAQEALTSLGIWDAVSQKASWGTNVTEVLHWVAAGSADVGIVYATDAATTGDVEVIAEAPAGSLARKVLYPVGMVAGSAHPEEARLLLDFLASDEALDVFHAYGFAPNK